MVTAVPHPSLYLSLGIAALVAWRLYSRVRRMVGRQRLTSYRPWITVVLFPVLLVLIALSALFHPWSLAALVVGAGLGAALGLYGLKLTRFEQTPQGLFYTPSAHLGIALSALFIVRVGYRMAQLYFVADAAAPAFDGFARSPLTVLIFGTLAGYYVSYAIGLLRWRQRVAAAPAADAASDA